MMIVLSRDPFALSADCGAGFTETSVNSGEGDVLCHRLCKLLILPPSTLSRVSAGRLGGRARDIVNVYIINVDNVGSGFPRPSAILEVV